MQSNQGHRNIFFRKWWLLFALMVFQSATSLWVARFGNFSKEAQMASITFTMRYCTVLFSLTYMARGLHLMFNSSWTRFLLVNRKLLGIAFAYSFVFHLCQLPFLHESISMSPVWLAINLIPIAFINSMGITSIPIVERNMSRKLWKIIHRWGSVAIWIALLKNYILIYPFPDLLVNSQNGQRSIFYLGSFLVGITPFVRLYPIFRKNKNRGSFRIKTFGLIFLLVTATAVLAQQNNFPKINPDSITIMRDKWGVPHIYAPTDSEVAYGLAWANSEDQFEYVQQTVALGKGMSGIIEGKGGAAKDFLSHLLGIKELVDSQYQTLSPAFAKYLDAYCQGLNSFAAKHPQEVLYKKLFPVSSMDILQSYVFMACFLSGVHEPVLDVINGKADSAKIPWGSNAYAMNSAKTTDGKTYLAINPHQPLDGPFSFYEAHLHSNEGLNITGALFPMGSSVFMGNTENLGWALTHNGYDLVDAYRLKMIDTKKLTYEFDGKELKLEKKIVKLKVRLGGWLTISVKKTVYWSVYGATIASKKNFYSLRSGANMTVKFPEQFYYMNKAQNLNDFRKALTIQGFPRFCITYADKENNVFLIDNGRVPERKEGYDWKGILPGNTSQTLWTGFYPEEKLPQLLNPECGYVYNMNNTPFSATCPGENLDSTDKTRFPNAMGFKMTNSNRSTRFIEIIESKNKFSFDEFKQIKNDTRLSDSCLFMKSVKLVFNLDTLEFPGIATAIKEINRWDRNAQKTSIGASYMLLSMDYIFKKYHYGYEDFFKGIKVTKSSLAEALQVSQESLMKNFHTLEVPLGDLQKIVRGAAELPVCGFSDALTANYVQPYKNGKYKAVAGDSYTHFVIFSKKGAEHIETLLPFGNSAYPESPHYTDQMKLYSEQKTKEMSIDKAVIIKGAERIYHPN